MSRDRSLERNVEAELKGDPHLDADHFGVSVNHRVVTLGTSYEGTVRLHGHVHSFHEKAAAEKAALATPGVTTVDNQITIQP
jgi:osmotically-inducible protein OsmY